ncbi:hypothetical protein [Lactobacillus sp. Sy-1]|uniref:hypothetical protein n=1 Tax=Lactobacillus sp. Sy-1 TaxID=2109645 RepID=UPI001C5AA50A|nr:hypothetical protein [Lactobacillus sp. Sy-1]MBW1606243.1 hypothetical protein [Lactobacillus sp. Sy-1]
MSKYTELKTNAFNQTRPSQYINEALAFVNYFQEDHNGVLSNDYAADINNHYPTAKRLVTLFNQINVSLKFKETDSNALYKVVLDGSIDPVGIDSITKDDLQNIHIVPVSKHDKEIIFSIIDTMVEEYLDETDSVHL